MPADHSMHDLTPRPSRHAPEPLESRLEFETLIADTSASLLMAPTEQVDAAVERALLRVREFFQADRCALLSVSADHQVVKVRLGSWGEGVAPVSPDVNLATLFPWEWRRLVVERLSVRISRRADLPSEAAAELPTWEQMGIRSALALPVETGAEVRHLIAIQTVHHELEWPDALVLRLRVLAELMVGALDRNQLLADLRQAEARMRSGADIAGLAYYEVDLGRRVAYFDDRLRDLCGVPPERVEALGPLDHWIEHLHPEDRPRILAERQRLHSGALEELSVEYRFLHPVRGQRWLHHLARVTRRDAGKRAVVTHGVIRDITNRKQADEERFDLSRRLIRAHEDERALLARELHDDVTQRLAVLAIDVGRAELLPVNVTQAETMRAVREGLSSLSEDVHALAYQLHPAVLEELGLVEALRTACERFGRRDGVELSTDLAPEAAGLEKDLALCLFRVAQEALNNVARHARASTASVTLRSRDGGLLLSVRDDGVGFDPADPETRRSLGMASMRERVRLVNGTLEVESAPGQGTAIVAWVPAGGAPP
jgi:PAS domain S-box-containing protein